jgi:hypothetical protein
MSKHLDQKRQRILQQIAEIRRLRRGQISEQYLTRTNAAGHAVRFGPYYVWQRTVDGQKHSDRIPAEAVPQARADLEAYERFRRLCSDLAAVNEEIAHAAPLPSDSKKNSTPK